MRLLIIALVYLCGLLVGLLVKERGVLYLLLTIPVSGIFLHLHIKQERFNKKIMDIIKDFQDLTNNKEQN